jgi:hypothetical protein
MPKPKRSKPKREPQPGPKEKRLIIDIDPEEAMMRLLKKPLKTTAIAFYPAAKRRAADLTFHHDVRHLPVRTDWNSHHGSLGCHGQIRMPDGLGRYMRGTLRCTTPTVEVRLRDLLA